MTILFAIFFRFCQSLTSNLPFFLPLTLPFPRPFPTPFDLSSFPLLFLSLGPFPDPTPFDLLLALRTHSSHLITQ